MTKGTPDLMSLREEIGRTSDIVGRGSGEIAGAIRGTNEVATTEGSCGKTIPCSIQVSVPPGVGEGASEVVVRSSSIEMVLDEGTAARSV